MSVDTNALTKELARIKNAKAIRSFCYTCPWNCPTEVFVRDNKIVYHKGNPESPNDIGSRCAKGMASFHLTQDPDRLKYPMKRTGAKGSGKFTRISWDEAFTIIADKLTEIKKKTRPRSRRLDVPSRSQYGIRPTPFRRPIRHA